MKKFAPLVFAVAVSSISVMTHLNALTRPTVAPAISTFVLAADITNNTADTASAANNANNSATTEANNNSQAANNNSQDNLAANDSDSQDDAD